jgi:dTDP-glucose 4,6-dehydratase
VSEKDRTPWQDAAVLVTGAGGFIGSHLAERLCRLGARVRAFVRYNSRGEIGQLQHVPPDVRQAIDVVMGDLKDAETVRKTVRGMEVVFHLGALVAIPYSYHSPLDFVQTNVLGTAHVLAAALDAGVRRIVHTSTSEVYGTAQYTPIDEKHPLRGQSPYSASKIAADMLVESYCRSFSLPAVTIRPFNTYGPRQSARAVIPAIIVQALTGDTVRLGATHPKRDFTYVGDTVEGFLRIAQGESVGEVFNVGSGREITIQELVTLIGRLMGKRLHVDVDDQRLRPPQSEVQQLIADASRARAVLGWRPQFSLDDGVATTIEWLKSHLHEYRPEVYAI